MCSVFFLALLLSSVPDAPPALLEVRDDRLVSTHELRIAVARPRQFGLALPVHRKAVFSGHPFAISVAAFIGDDSFVMMHAERVLDRSGASDYSSLDAFILDGRQYRTKVQCAALTLEDAMGEHDLRFLATNKFVPTPAIYLRQLFRTTEDHNAEVVITYGERVSACPAPADEVRFRSAFDARLARTVSVAAEQEPQRVSQAKAG